MKYFQFAENMFNQNAFPSQSTISVFFLFCQRMVFGFLEWCLAIFMEFCQTLVTSVCQYSNMLGNLASVVFEKLKNARAQLENLIPRSFESEIQKIQSEIDGAVA